MSRGYDVLDEALDMLSDCGPDLRNGNTSHAPMAAEALCALDRADAVRAWVERYRRDILPRPAARERIAPEHWRAALAQPERFADWSALFGESLREAPWRAVLDQWVDRLAPGVCAAATHGIIRVGHAARGLADAETPRRLAELADALASWTTTYQELSTATHGASPARTPDAALAQVALVPAEQRRFSGTIVSSLYALNDFPPFAPVIRLLDVSGDPAELAHQLTDVFAQVYIANAHDFLTSIVLVHGVTSLAALGNVVPHVRDDTARRALAYGWQAACGLYAAFGSRATPAGEIETPAVDRDMLIDMAVRHGDDHAIKFTEACLHQHAARPSAAFLTAARHALDTLPPPA